MTEGTIRQVYPGPSTAFDASCAFDSIKVELEGVASTARLLAASELLDETAQDAFRCVGDSLDAIICRVNARSTEFMQVSAAEKGA